MVSPDSKHVISTYCQWGVKRSLKELVVGENLLDFSFLEISGLHFSLLSSESSGGFRPCRQALAPCPLPLGMEDLSVEERAGKSGRSGGVRTAAWPRVRRPRIRVWGWKKRTRETT